MSRRAFPESVLQPGQPRGVSLPPMKTAVVRLLMLLVVVGVAVPLIPFLAFGTRLDEWILDWITPPPAPGVLALLEVGVLAVDLLLPVPSSVVATLGGATLGVAAGTVCAWVGMTAGSLAGWWLGRAAGGRALNRLAAEDLQMLQQQERRLGPMLVVLTRPVPLLAEAAALVAGAAGMPLRDFFLAAATGNGLLALVWSALGAAGREAGSLPMALLAALVLPVALAWLVVRRQR